jgi:hypothetical protein
MYGNSTPLAAVGAGGTGASLALTGVSYASEVVFVATLLLIGMALLGLARRTKARP